MINVLSPWWRSILLTTTWHVRFTDELVVTLLAENTIYNLLWLSSCLTLAVAWHDWYMITVLSPCWWSILLTTTWHVWYTDEHVVTLLADHTILLPGRRPHINFHVCVLHLKNIHTIVPSWEYLLCNKELSVCIMAGLCVCVCVCVQATRFQGVLVVITRYQLLPLPPRESPPHMCYPVVLALRAPWGAFRRGFQRVPRSLDSRTHSDVTTWAMSPQVFITGTTCILS